MEQIKAPRSWTPKQRARLKKLQADPNAWVGWWWSNLKGFPFQGGSWKVPVRPGMVQKLLSPTSHKLCHSGFHATRHPADFGSPNGARLWVVALRGPREDCESKSCASTREIIGEVRFSPLRRPEKVDPTIARWASTLVKREKTLTMRSVQHWVPRLRKANSITVEHVLRQVVPIWGRYFEANNCTVAGLNPAIIHLSKQTQWILARRFQTRQWTGVHGQRMLYPQVPVPGFPTRPCTPKPPKV